MLYQPYDYEKKVNEMYNLHFKKMLAHAYWWVKDWTDAEDLAIKAFAAVFRYPEKCPPDEQVRSFLHQRIVWMAKTDYKQVKKQKDRQQDYGENWQPDPVINPEYLLIAEEVSAQIWEEIEKLPRQRRDVIKLQIEGFTTKEIADQLGIGVQTVRNVRMQARDKLEDELRKKGIHFLLAFLYLYGNG